MRYHLWQVEWSERREVFDLKLTFDNADRFDTSTQPMAIEGFMMVIYRFPERETPEYALEILRQWMLENLVTRPAEADKWFARIKAMSPGTFTYVIDEGGAYHGPWRDAQFHKVSL